MSLPFRLRPRAFLLLGLFLPLALRLRADDHIRTGGQYQEPYPYGAPGSVIRTDQRFHPGDPSPSCNYIYLSCHAGDVIQNPAATNTFIDVVIPAGINLTWNQSIPGGPQITWPGTGAPGGGSAKVIFQNFPNTKTIRLKITSDFTPVSDNFNLSNIGFNTVGLLLSTPCGPGNLVDNVVETAGTIAHIDDATIRVSEYCTAAPGGGFAVNQVISPGTTVAMDPITITETATAANRGIWAIGAGPNFDNGIRITIPSGTGVTFNPAVVNVTCSGTAVPAHLAASTAVAYEDSNRTVRIPVSSDFDASNTVTISGLQLTTSPSASDQTFSLDIRTGKRANTNDLTVPGSSRPTKQIVGLPTISSTAVDQFFTAGDPPTNASPITIVDAAGSPKITSTDGLRIIIPNANMTFDTSITSVTCSGSAVPAKMPVTTNGVTYTGGTGNNKIAIIPVGANFSGGDDVTISGLRFMNFTGATALDHLELECKSTRAGVEGTDNHGIRIGRPTISSASDQVFVTPPPNPMATLTITDDASNPRIGTGPNRVSQLRIVIPAGFNMTWQGASPAIVSGKLNAAVGYAGGNKILILTANANFTAGETATVSGLNFTTGAASLPDNLELWMSASGLASATSEDDKIIAIGGVPTMTSSSNQQFTVNDPSTIGNNIILQDAASPSFQNGNTLQIIIPSGLNMTFNTLFIPTAVPGAGSGTVGARSFPDNKTLNIPITADFTGNQTLTLGNIRYTNFLGASGGAVAMQVKVTVGGPVAATDLFTKAIGAPTIASAAGQVFGVLDPSTQAANIVITDDLNTPRIKQVTDIRVRIPSTFNMEWDTTVLPSTSLSAGGAGAVNTPFFQSTKILVVPVATNFSGGKSLTLSGARFRNFSGVSGTDNLELEVNNQGTVIPNAFDTQTIKIGTRPTITSILTQDNSGNGSIDTLRLTFSEAINGSTTSVSSGLGFSVAGHTISTGSASGNILTFNLIETGNPDTGATPVVSYDPLVGNLIDVDDPLKLVQTTLVGTSDGSKPTIVGFSAVDLDGNGRIDQVTFTFSENLATGQADINDWTLVDADGQTDLLAGLTNTNVVIDGTNVVTINLSNAAGTSGSPRYQYQSDGLGGTLQDGSGNIVLLSTNNSPPVAKAGPDQSLAPSLVTLDGSASFDPDKQPLTYRWSQVMIPAPPVVVMPTPILSAKTTIFTTTPGQYTFQLDVSDGLTTRSDTVNVTILNIAPTAVAVVNQVAQVGVVCEVVASLSSDINGPSDIPIATGFNWTKVSGPPATMAGATSRFLNVTPSAAGVYVFEVTVTDSAANTSKSQVMVRAFDPVAVPPQAVPTADAGPDQVHAVGTPVTLDGRLSTSPIPGRTLSYAWAGPVTLSNPTSSTPSFTPTIAGVYTFQLTVTDNQPPNIASAPDSVSIFVFDPANKPPVALANRFTPTSIPVVGDLITLDSTGSFDPEGATLDYIWSQVEGPALILSHYNTATTSFTPITPGTYGFQLIVTDGVQQSPPVKTRFQVLRNAGDTPTTVTAVISSAVLGNGHVSMAAPITLTAANQSGSQSDTYWEQLEGPAVFINSGGGFAPWYGNAVTFTAPIPGRYVFQVYSLRFGDLLMAQSSVEVIVDSAGNTSPIADAGADQTKTAGDLITLSSALSSGDSTRFYWTQLAGPPVELSDPFGTTPTFTAAAAGTYVFALTTSDGSAASSKAVTVVTVGAGSGSAPASGGGGGGCGLSIEPLLLLGVVAFLRRRLR